MTTELQDEETRQNLVNKHGSRKGKVDWSSPEFLRAVARCALTDISLVETFVFSAAFSTFDQDVDGYICPEDMRGLASLYTATLPPLLSSLAASCAAWSPVSPGLAMLRTLLTECGEVGGHYPGTVVR